MDDLAHVVPWFSSLTHPGRTVAFFRHLHHRTLSGQVNPLSAILLTSIERSYVNVYSKCPIVVESKSSLCDLEQMGVGHDQIVQIPPGVDSGAFFPSAKSITPLIVYFGGLRRYKRPECVLFVVAKVLNEFPDVECYIIGDGPEAPRLRRLSKSLGLDGSVRFTGRVSEIELRSLVSRSWVNLHCSVAEGWCLSALEASSCGVPTVGFAVPGLRDSVAPGRSGILVNDGDLGALQKAVETVLRNPGAWTESCRSYALGFGWNKTSSKWLGLLEGVVYGNHDLGPSWASDFGRG